MQQDSITINRKPPYVTYTLIGLNVLIFIVQMILKYFVLGESQMLLWMGAKENTLITLGQYWRLFTAMFLHSSITHILFNAFALYIWGRQLEVLLGRMRYLIVYITAGLFGSLMSYLCSPNAAVGASGAIFGLFGALLYFRLRHKQLFDKVFGMQVLVVIGVNLVIGFLGNGIDNFGHIGGLIGGFLMAYATGLYGERLSGLRIPALIGVIALFLAGLAFGVILYSNRLGVPPFTFVSMRELMLSGG